MRKHVLLDIDGVVLNLLEGLRKVLAKQGFVFIKENVEDYSFHGDIGCERERIFAEFNKKDVYEASPLYDGVDLYIKKLLCCVDVEPFTVVQDYSEVVEARENLLVSLGLNPIIYKGRTKPYRPEADALIEDCLETCIDWLERGYEGEIYLIDHTYNRNIPAEYKELVESRIVRCNGFIDAVERCITYGV